MSKARALTFTIALAASTMAMAAEPEPTATSPERRLSPEQIEQVLADAARKREGRDQGVQPQPSTSDSAPTAVHGEVGVSIGTGGHRSAYGTAYIGLPGNGSAVLSAGIQGRSNDHYFYPAN